MNSLWKAFKSAFSGGKGEDVAVGPGWAVLLTLAALAIYAAAIIVILRYYGAASDPQLKDLSKSTILGLAMLSGGFGGLTRGIIEASRSYRSGEIMTFPVVGVSILLAPIGVFVGFMVWALFYGGLLEVLFPDSAPTLKPTVYAVLGMSGLIAFFSDRYLKTAVYDAKSPDSTSARSATVPIAVDKARLEKVEAEKLLLSAFREVAEAEAEAEEERAKALDDATRASAQSRKIAAKERLAAARAADLAADQAIEAGRIQTEPASIPVKS